MSGGGGGGWFRSYDSEPEEEERESRAIRRQLDFSHSRMCQPFKIIKWPLSNLKTTCPTTRHMNKTSLFWIKLKVDLWQEIEQTQIGYFHRNIRVPTTCFLLDKNRKTIKLMIKDCDFLRFNLRERQSLSHFEWWPDRFIISLIALKMNNKRTQSNQLLIYWLTGGVSKLVSQRSRVGQFDNHQNNQWNIQCWRRTVLI